MIYLSRWGLVHLPYLQSIYIYIFFYLGITESTWILLNQKDPTEDYAARGAHGRPPDFVLINRSLFLTLEIFLLLKWPFFFCFFFMKTTRNLSIYLSIYLGGDWFTSRTSNLSIYLFIYLGITESTWILLNQKDPTENDLAEGAHGRPPDLVLINRSLFLSDHFFFFLFYEKLLVIYLSIYLPRWGLVHLPYLCLWPVCLLLSPDLVSSQE